MRVTESCAKCLYDKQKHLSDNGDYLSEIKEIIDNRNEEDTSPWLVYLFNRTYEKHFGQIHPYKEIKEKYNNLVLSMEDSLRNRIEASENPLVQALIFARAGNYIDFGAMNEVDEETFLSLFEERKLQDKESKVLESFLDQCGKARSFLLIADNCGEIVLDKLFLEQLQKSCPELQISVLVRGGEVLNDATREDAEYAGLDKVAEIISSGVPVAGTIYEMLPDQAKKVLDHADVILAKGQGNYESLSRQGRHIFYSFLCKCELFTERFQVPKFTGIFVEEWE